MDDNTPPPFDQNLTTVLREKTELQWNHVDGGKTASRIDLGLEWNAHIPPNPLYYSGRLKKVGDPVYYAFLVTSDSPPTNNGGVCEPGVRELELITYHADEIGTRYVDAASGADSGLIFARVQHLNPGAPVALTLSRLLADELAERRWTQARLAQELDLPRPRINEYLSGKRKLTLPLAQTLHRKLGIAATTLLTLEE